MFDFSGLGGILIALGALAIVVVLFLLWRMGILTKKTVPIVGGVLAAIFGAVILRERGQARRRRELAAKEKQLREREKRLKELRESAAVSDAELDAARAELDREREEHARETLRIEAETEEEKARIDELSGDEVFDEFRRAFGSGGTGGEG